MGTVLGRLFDLLELKIEEMTDRYRYLADKYNCLLAPVGEKWWEHIHKYPEVDLFAADRRHASNEGSMLIAKTIFESLDIK